MESRRERADWCSHCGKQDRVSSEPWNMKNGGIYWGRYKIQETLNIGQWRLSPLQGRHAPWDLPQFSQSPSPAPSYFPESHQRSEISFLSKVSLVLGKARSHRAPNLGCRGDESPGWFHVSPKNSARDMMCEWAHCRDEGANDQLVAQAEAFWFIQRVSARMLKLNVKFDANSLPFSLSHFACDDHTVHTLTQRRLPPPLTGTVKPSLFTRAHSSALSLAARLHRCHTNHSRYINNGRAFSKQISSYILRILRH